MSEKLLRIRDVAAMVGCGHAEIYRRVAAGTFPKQIPIGTRMSRWLHSEVQQWIAQEVARCRQPKVRRAS